MLILLPTRGALTGFNGSLAVKLSRLEGRSGDCYRWYRIPPLLAWLLSAQSLRVVSNDAKMDFTNQKWQADEL